MIALLRNPIVTGLAGAGIVALLMGWQLVKSQRATQAAQTALASYQSAALQSQNEAVARLQQVHAAEMRQVSAEREQADTLVAEIQERERRAADRSRRLQREINELARTDVDAAKWMAIVPPPSIRMRGAEHGSCADCDRGSGSEPDNPDPASGDAIDPGPGFTARLDYRGLTYSLRAGSGRIGRVQYAVAED